MMIDGNAFAVGHSAQNLLEIRNIEDNPTVQICYKRNSAFKHHLAFDVGVCF